MKLQNSDAMNIPPFFRQAHICMLAGAMLAIAGTMPAAQDATPARMLVVSANDQASGYAGKMYVRAGARPGSISVIDFAVIPARSWHIEGVPCSVVGPPSCVAISSSGDEIFVTASMQPDPGSPQKLRPDSRVTRLRLGKYGLERSGDIDIGTQPSGISLSRDGRRAWVALRGEGAIALLDLSRGGMRVAGKWTFGGAADSLSDVELSPDERAVFATMHSTGKLLVLLVNKDGSLTEKQRLQMPRGPYHVSFLPDGKRALIGCTVDDVMCVLEERGGSWSLVDKIPTGRTPEGVFVSPDGRWVAATCFDGANMLIEKNKWFGQPSRIYVYSIDASGRIERKQTIEMKNVLQGAAFTADSRRLVAGQFGEGNLRVFELNGKEWRDTGMQIEIPGQSAAMTATK